MAAGLEQEIEMAEREVMAVAAALFAVYLAFVFGSWCLNGTKHE